jgi:hypothetical protein
MSVTVGIPHPKAAALSNAATITWRNLLGYVRVPQVIFFSSLQPIMFILLFRYVFGGAITRALPPGGSHQLTRHAARTCPSHPTGGLQ